jgi:hypothetical protein
MTGAGLGISLRSSIVSRGTRTRCREGFWSCNQPRIELRRVTGAGFGLERLRTNAGIGVTRAAHTADTLQACTSARACIACTSARAGIRGYECRIQTYLMTSLVILPCASESRLKQEPWVTHARHSCGSRSVLPTGASCPETPSLCVRQCPRGMIVSRVGCLGAVTVFEV